MSKLLKESLRKTVAGIVALATILSLSGVVAFAPVVAQAATIADGALIKSNAVNSDGTPTYASLDVYIVKLVGTKKFKRLMLNPQVLTSYGHLKNAPINVVDQATMDSYTTSALVRVDTDPAQKVFALVPNGDIGAKSWINLTAAQVATVTAYDPEAVYTINSVDGGNYTAVTDVTTVDQLQTFFNTGTLPGVVAAGGLTVGLSSSTPASRTVPANATAAAADVVITKVNLTAGTTDAVITGLKVTRTGLSQNAAVSAVKLFVDGVQIGTSQNLNSSNQAVFNSISLTVPAGSTKTLDLAASMALSATYNGNIIGLSINSATDITTASTVTGTFPVVGNVVSLSSSVTIGTATLYNGTSGTRNTTDLTVDSDAANVRFTQVKITAGSTEGLIVNQITAVKNGTAANTDVKDIKLVNDTTGATVGTAATLDANGRAVFSGLSIAIAKGGSLELSILATLNNSGSGRTIAFDLHDGTAYTIKVVGDAYGFGITPTRNDFCAAAGTCTAQSINQGYLTVQKSASAPATGKIAIGGSAVPLMAFDFAAFGEPINVTSTIITYTTADGSGAANTGARTNVTNVVITKADGSVIAGPLSGDTSHTTAGVETLTFTDAYTLPAGTTTLFVKANLSSSMAATNTIVVAMAAGAVTAKGANSGKVTYTTSAGATVPPTSTITGNTLTLQGPALAVITAASPVAGSIVVNAQKAVFANFDLDASASGEDVKVTSVIVTDTLGGGALVYTGVNNLELWGIQDNTTGTTIAKLETSNSTAVNAATKTFTFTTPLKIKKGTTSRLTLKADAVTSDTDGGAVADTHTFSIAGTAGDVVSTGYSTGSAITETYTGAGQAMTIQTSGRLAVTKSADMPSASQLVSATTGNEVMKYKFTSSFEPIDVTEFVVYAGNNGQAGTATTLANIAKVFVYANGTLIGNTTGYTLDAAGRATVTLDNGTFVVPKDSNSTLTIKIDIPAKDQVTTSTSTNVQIGLEGAGAAGTTQNKDNTWGDAANVNSDYWMVATGKDSGATIAKNTINDLGTTAVSTIYGSNGFSIHKGILTISLNSASPTGTQTAGTNKEVLRLDLAATGDDITMDSLELVSAGTGVVTGTGDLTVKSSDLSTTYATVTGALCNTYSNPAASTICLLSGQAIAIGANGCTAGDADGSNCTTGWATADNLVISAGTTKTIRIFGDTTGAATTLTRQLSVSNAALNNYTDNGASYKDSSGTVVGLTASTFPVIKNLPLSGGSINY